MITVPQVSFVCPRSLLENLRKLFISGILNTYHKARKHTGKKMGISKRISDVTKNPSKCVQNIAQTITKSEQVSVSFVQNILGSNSQAGT